MNTTTTEKKIIIITVLKKENCKRTLKSRAEFDGEGKTKCRNEIEKKNSKQTWASIIFREKLKQCYGRARNNRFFPLNKIY